MRTITLSIAALLLVTLGAFTKIETLTVTSPAFTNNSPIPVKFTCMGQEVSPPLSIANIPAGAKSLAIIVCDPDAVKTIPVTTVTHKKGHKKPIITKTTRTECGFAHWVVWNVDVSNNIPENFRPENVGMNGAKVAGYKGMCPPTGMHHYHFIVYALDTKFNVDKNTDQAGLEKVMAGHILAKGVLIGTYDKMYR